MRIRRHRQPEIGHFGQVGTLTTQQIFKILITFGEVINELRHFLLLVLLFVLLFAARDIVYSPRPYRR